MTQETPEQPCINELRRSITDEIYKALGLTPLAWYHGILDKLFRGPALHFSQIAASFDHLLVRSGLPTAARGVLPNFISSLEVRGNEVLPTQGALLLASNHPGAADSLCHAASLERQDLKIIAGDVPFLRGLPNMAKHLIPVTDELQTRMRALRAGLRHLQEGGALLLFCTGRIDPDPEVHSEAEAELEGWSGSVEVFLRRVPRLQTVLAIASGVVARSCARTPLIYLKQTPLDRRRIAEFVQVMLQMGWGWKFGLDVHMSYGRPFTLDTLDNRAILQEIKQRARQLLADHQVARANRGEGRFHALPLG